MSSERIHGREIHYSRADHRRRIVHARPAQGRSARDPRQLRQHQSHRQREAESLPPSVGRRPQRHQRGDHRPVGIRPDPVQTTEPGLTGGIGIQSDQGEPHPGRRLGGGRELPPQQHTRQRKRTRGQREQHRGPTADAQPSPAHHAEHQRGHHHQHTAEDEQPGPDRPHRDLPPRTTGRPVPLPHRSARLHPHRHLAAHPQRRQQLVMTLHQPLPTSVQSTQLPRDLPQRCRIRPHQRQPTTGAPRRHRRGHRHSAVRTNQRLHRHAASMRSHADHNMSTHTHPTQKPHAG